MKLTQKIQKAINIASEKHLGQVRKSDGLPYITHPFTVAIILSEYTDDEDVICAGLLHDVLEDVKGYGYANLEKDFGWKIASIVREVSEDKDPDVESNQKATWKKRKMGYLKHLEKASREAMLVCAADKIHNLLSMIKAYREEGEKMWEQFNSSPEESLWFYKKCLKILSESLDSKIVKYLGYAYVGAEKMILEGINLFKASPYTTYIITEEDLKLASLDPENTMFETENKPTYKKTEKKPKYSEDFILKTRKEFEAQYIEDDSKYETSQDKAIRKHWAFEKYLRKKISKKDLN